MIEVLLRRVGPDVFGESGSVAQTPKEIGDADRELLAAYLERRLSRREERVVSRRLSAEPALRNALTDLIKAARGTECGEGMLSEAEGAEQT